MPKCQCGSYAINPQMHGRDNTDLELCDVCYWRKRADANFSPNKIFRQNGKKWILPFHVKEGGKLMTKESDYRVVAFKMPRKGEIYLSGSIPEYYKALNDLSTEYLVIQLKD